MNILNEDQRTAFEGIPEGKRLLDLAHEYDVIQKRIKHTEEEENLSKLHLDTSGAFQYLLQPTSEEQISEEIKNTSPGIQGLSCPSYSIGGESHFLFRLFTP